MIYIKTKTKKMKRINQKHDVVINIYYKPVFTNASVGDIEDHYTYVNSVYFYKRQFIQDQEVFTKVEMTRQMILDLADEIREIEKEIIKKPYELF